MIDSAFSSADAEYHIKSSQDFMVANDGLEDHDDVIYNLAVKRAATSMRQSAEWGMRGVQASFPCLIDTIPHEEYGERKMIVTCLLLLYNCRARINTKLGMCIYLPHLQKDANMQFVPYNN